MIQTHFTNPLGLPAKMKLAAALAGVLLVTAACGGSSSGAGDTSGPAGLKGKTVDFVGYGKDNPWGAYFNGVFVPKLESQGVKVVDLTTMDPGTAVTNFNQAISPVAGVIPRARSLWRIARYRTGSAR